MQQASAGIGRVESLLLSVPGLRAAGTATLPAAPLSVELDRVTFSYENGDSVLHDISLCLQPGETVGLLGRTGSGKTTLARLLARLYDPDAGSIRLAGVPVPDVADADLRRRVGVVTQDVQFFRATVRDNLTFFRSEHGPEGTRDSDILGVFRELGLWEWYRALPDGLDTMLGPGGAGLSAGQSQLLAFARIFLRDRSHPAGRPGLVILDEATSRLDPATERYVERAVDRLLTGRTGIVVAHRLRTVGRLDRIVILEGGRIVEAGRRAELMQNPHSRFNALLRAGLETGDHLQEVPA
jgi:ATP-binding cassette subfamily B protein